VSAVSEGLQRSHQRGTGTRGQVLSKNLSYVHQIPKQTCWLTWLRFQETSIISARVCTNHSFSPSSGQTLIVNILSEIRDSKISPSSYIRSSRAGASPFADLGVRKCLKRVSSTMGPAACQLRAFRYDIVIESSSNIRAGQSCAVHCQGDSPATNTCGVRRSGIAASTCKSDRSRAPNRFQVKDQDGLSRLSMADFAVAAHR